MFTPDELAGVVDLFGALTREELDAACSELAYRRGEEPPEGAVDEALSAFALVAFEADDETEELLAPGPAAFPTMPDGAEDLPHILDTETRAVDRAEVARAAEKRLRTEAARAVSAGDAERADELLDISYDIEAWGGVDLSGIRDRLDDADNKTN
ncbi:DUF7109 family protein [Natronomonas amylolytica]|uniref:DUF7109 family protein n=1 Tax=Natronomonas amylolytica TaxID=3108498 RepID=UPI003008C8AF